MGSGASSSKLTIEIDGKCIEVKRHVCEMKNSDGSQKFILYDKEHIIYEGSMKNGKFHEYGTIYYTPSISKIDNEQNFQFIAYQGNFKDGEFDGNGTLYYENGLINYEGGYNNGEFHGNGKLYYENGNMKYKGNFAMSKAHGKGIGYYEDGTIQYEGEFKNGNYNGKGMLYNENGDVINNGIFANGIFIGEIDNVNPPSYSDTKTNSYGENILDSKNDIQHY